MGAGKGELLLFNSVSPNVNGEWNSFMWRYAAAKQDAGSEKEKQFHVYRWTGKNKYVALCEPDYISFGGG